MLTYLYISLVDLFIYFYLPSPTTRQDSPEVKRFPMAQVIHAVESVVLITSQGGLPASTGGFCPCLFGKVVRHPRQCAETLLSGTTVFTGGLSRPIRGSPPLA